LFHSVGSHSPPPDRHYLYIQVMAASQRSGDDGSGSVSIFRRLRLALLNEFHDVAPLRDMVLLECTKWKDGVEKVAHVRLTLASPKRPSFKEAGIMDHKKTSNHHGHLNRRSFLDAAGRLAGGGLAVGAIFETIRPSSAWGQQPAKETHPSSARVVD